MGRRATLFWHGALWVGASVLYFFFVLPRWPELTGETSHGLGTVARIVAGLLIALAALPVVFTLLRSRKPEFGTPALALSLQTWSVVAHVAAGVLIVGTAISEIWLSLDSVGQWLFGVYGAAAAIAVLGIAGFYLSFVAELPPPPPKPLKPKKERTQRRRGKKGGDLGDTAEADEDSGDTPQSDDESETTDDDTQASAESPGAETTPVEAESTASEAPAIEDVAETEDAEDAEVSDTEDAEDVADPPDIEDAEPGGLRNRRPSGKRLGTHRRRSSRRGIAVDE